MEPIMPMENQSSPLPELPAFNPQNSEASFDIPQTSAEFRTVPNTAEEFGKVPQTAERKENHALTVRETARMFESAGVARTERSIINWCQPNRQGITRLDSYYDPNERKYYITPQSIEAVIQEELQRANKPAELHDAESFGSSLAHVKHPQSGTSVTNGANKQKFHELEREIRDLKITNRAKDMFIDQLKSERSDFFDKLLSANQTVGRLETKLQKLDGLN
jgi:hypothetical protein